MVLERVSALVNTGGAESERMDVWVERGVQEGDRMKDAIEAHVKPGTPEQKAGEFRAVPLTSWKGGRRYKMPEQVSLLGEDLD